ncbi:MAG: AraC family ligand binding domain-containing protein, partial [Suipraeoptans sp.]
MPVHYEKQYSSNKYNFFHLLNDSYYTTDLHCHDFIEIYLTISGGKFFLLNDTFYSMEKGDLFVVNSLDIHRVIRQEDICYERYVLEYKPLFVQPFCTAQADLMHYVRSKTGSNAAKLSLPPETLEHLLEMFKKYESLDENSFGYDLKKQICFLEILAYIAEIFLEDPTPEDNYPKNINPLVSSLLTYIGENITADLRLDNLASQVNVDKHYLCHLFKKCTGITINN